MEDKGILTAEYFRGVAQGNQQWRAILERPSEKSDINRESENLLFPRVLGDKAFTFALFETLDRDFNGDIFPRDPKEQQVITKEHLSLLQGFFRGDSDPQQKLFFSAYKFDIIPIELISSIYEEFYHVQNGKSTQGSFYTPPALVEFILFQVLTPKRLEENPKIIDPACGSGIFLVEAFRRIVRYHTRKRRRRLSFQSLRNILREQIRGIDINPEAIRVAAFSLYLAMLHYLDSVFNFAHPRKVFFRSSNAPFATVIFRKLKNEKPFHRTHYWSAKRTANVESLQAVLFSRNDLKLIRQTESMKGSKLWKIYWWGNHRDEELIRYLEMDSQLKDLTKPGLFGQGFKQANQKYESGWLKKYEELPVQNFYRYGALDSARLVDVPQKVERRGVREVYEGSRLLVKRGITERALPKGRIVARFERDSFCFRNSIHGIKITRDKEWQYKCVLAILWSSLARYYFFMTSSAWGSWYHEINEEELLDLPIRFPKEQALRKEIIELVDRLRAFPPQRKGFGFDQGSYVDEMSPAIAELENRLDNAIFDLFELSEVERDLVRDLCNTGIDYFYSASKSLAGQALVSGRSKSIQGTYADLGEKRNALNGFKEYLRVFLEIWNRELEPDGEFSWRIVAPSDDSAMVCVVFSAQRKGSSPKQVATSPEREWKGLLLSLGKNMMVPFGTQNIFIDGIVRAVSDEQIIIVKRNENRLWTKSMAREDAEATLVQAMNRDSAGKGIRI